MESCFYPRPTDSESPDPRGVLMTVQSEKRWFRGPGQVILWLHSPQGQQRGPGGVATWSPAPSRPCSEHLDPRIPDPNASASLPPGAHVPARQEVKIQLLWVGRGRPELGLEGWACSSLSSRFLRAQRGPEPEVGRAGEGLGADPLCCPAFWLQTPGSRNPSLPGGYKSVFDSVLA